MLGGPRFYHNAEQIDNNVKGKVKIHCPLSMLYSLHMSRVEVDPLTAPPQAIFMPNQETHKILKSVSNRGGTKLTIVLCYLY